MTKVFNSMALI